MRRLHVGGATVADHYDITMDIVGGGALDTPTTTNYK
jgi:hypothetical protein